MKLLRLLLVLGSIFFLTVLFFIVYTQFLADYSLENLEFSLKASSEKNPTEVSPLVNNLYGALVESQAMEEAAKGEMRLSDIALIEKASFSFEEASFRNSYKGARLYLQQLIRSRTSLRNPALRAMDALTQRTTKAMANLTRYIRGRFEVRKSTLSLSELSNDLVLNRARELEKKGDMSAAAELYRKYIARYPNNANIGYVSIALANILLRQSRLGEAETLLRNTASKYFGSEEAELAVRFLKKIDFIKRGNALIPRLKTMMASAKNDQVRDALRIKLALTYLSLYQLNQAEETLKAVLSNKNSTALGQAKFYLGWLYKLRRQYGEGEQILLDLLDDPDLAPDLELGLHAGLADIYYQQNQPRKALKHYQALRKKSKKELEQLKKAKDESVARGASEEAWLGVSELEASNIYYFNLNDSAQAALRLDSAAEAFGISNEDSEALKKDVRRPAVGELRSRAFRALEMRKINLAYELFSKSALLHPNDAWTYGGLSTIYVLLGDMNLAIENAERSYQLGNDEYTASALGYVYGLVGRHKEAAAFYRQAIQLNSGYFPARFNLSYNYLKLEEYDKALEILNSLDRFFGSMKTTSRAKVRNNMGYALWKTGRRAEAAQSFREALQINPDFLIAKKNLSVSSSPEAAA